MPIFALANAGVVLSGDAIDHALSSRVTIGIVAGLVVGKFVGILGVSALAVRTRLGALPGGLGLHHVAGIAVLAGIGFTVSLFITDLAFRGEVIDDAKIGVLARVGARRGARHDRVAGAAARSGHRHSEEESS